MSFEKYICWKPEELNSIIHTEAEASPDDVFLAIHTDNKIKVSTSGSKSKNMTYQNFLNDFLDGNHGNNVQAVIEGESGSGKSHLVQWMRLHIPKNENTIVLTIPKTQTNLHSVLKKLIEYLPNEEQIKYKEKLHRSETGLKSDSERINEFLSSLARTIEKDTAQGTKKDEESYLIPLLPNLFDDPYFREAYFNNHPIINNIISLIFSNSSINRNSDNRQEFKKEHLPLNAREATKAAKPTQEVLDALLEEEFLKISLEIINRNLDKAITRTLSFSPDDLIELMSDMRLSLYQKNKELILLIEDFAQLQGVDTALLQVLTVEGSGQLCKIKWAMAVTTGYFEKLEDTVRTRMTFKVNMDSLWDQNNITSQNKYILQLGSKYLNAIRLGHTNIKKWYLSYLDDRSPVDNSCERCQHKIVCHKAFGSISGIGLYPFNEHALLKMAREADKEKHNVFRPRIFINKVLKRNLNKHMVQILKDSQYPPRDLFEDFNTEQLDFDEHNNLTKIDPINYLRRETLLELWSDTNKIINLDENVHTAFALPRLDAFSTASTIGNSKEETLTTVLDTSILGKEPMSDKDENIKNIEQWGRGKDLHHSTASKLRPLIFNAIVNYIDWDFLPVSQSMNILRQGNIYFTSDSSRRPTSGFVLDIEQNTDMAIVLKTFYSMNKEKNIPLDITAFANLQELVKQWAEYLIEEIVKEYKPYENWNPVKATIELLAISSIVCAEKPSVNSLLTSKLEFKNMSSNKLDGLIVNVLFEVKNGISSREEVFQDVVKKMFSGRKGGVKTSAFIDAGQILPVISQLKKNNWHLTQDPSLETRKDFKDIAVKYSKWQTDFEDALTDELIERFKWLDELENNIKIEDIGMKFKNQIKNVRELAAELGIPGYTSISLDNALLCNLSQAKTAMEITLKLKEQSTDEIFEDLFPSRKDDAKQFIQLTRLYEEVLNKFTSGIKSRTDELNRRTGLSSINLEIKTSMNKIDKNFHILLGENNDAS